MRGRRANEARRPRGSRARSRRDCARARVVRFPSRAPGGDGRAGNARHEVDALDPESLRDLVGLELVIDGQRRAHGLRVRSRVVGHRGRAARGGEGKGKRGAIERQRRFPRVRTRSREAGTRARTTCRAYLPSNETCRCAEPLSGAAVSARSARAPGQARRVQNVWHAREAKRATFGRLVVSSEWIYTRGCSPNTSPCCRSAARRGVAQKRRRLV